MRGLSWCWREPIPRDWLLRERGSAGGAQLDEACGSSHHIRPGRDGLSPGVACAACCAAQQHAQHHAPRRAAPRRAALLDCAGAVAPGGVKRGVVIAPVIHPALR